MRMQEMHFKKHVTLHVMESVQQGLYKFNIVQCYAVTEEVLDDGFQHCPCPKFNVIRQFIKVTIFHQLPYLWPYKYSFVYLCITYIRKLLCQVFKTLSILVHGFNKVFINPSLMCRGGRMTF